MRKLLLPVMFMAFMLLNAAAFVLIAREFDGSKTVTKQTTSEQLRRR